MVFEGLFWAPGTRLRSFKVHFWLLVVHFGSLGVNLGLNESILGLRVDFRYLRIILELWESIVILLSESRF